MVQKNLLYQGGFNMKNSKKVIGLLLMMTFTITMLFTGFTKAAAPAVKKAPVKKTTVTAWIQTFMADPAKEKVMWDGFVKKFEKANPTIKMNLQTIPWASRDQRMLTAFSADKGPDVVYLIPDHLAQFGYMGIVEPLDKLISKKVKDGYMPNALDAATINGKLYGLPMLETVMGWYYNTDMLKAAGWDINKLPTNWTEFLACCEAVKKSGKVAYYGMELGGSVNMTYYPYLWQAGGNILDKKGNVTIDSAATRKSLEFMRTLYEKGYAPEDSITATDQHDVLVKEQKIAIAFSASYPVDAQGFNFNWKLGPALKDKKTATYGTIGSWAISHTSKNKAGAAKWITFLTEPAQMTTFLKNTGYFAPTKALQNLYKDDPVMNELSKQAKNVIPGVIHPAGRAILDLINPELQGVVMGKQTADEAIKKLVPAIKQAITDSLALKP
jgi:multiple sugar transport system substrate-binding protein